MSLEYGLTDSKISTTWPREERYLTEEFSQDPAGLGLEYFNVETNAWRKPWAVRRWRRMQAGKRALLSKLLGYSSNGAQDDDRRITERSRDSGHLDCDTDV